MMGSLANYFDYEAFARELFNREQTVTFSAEYDPSNRLINFFLILSVEIL